MGTTTCEMSQLLVLALFALAAPSYSAPPKDAVLTLPSYGTPPSPMWSGYLDASASTPGTMLHYWFSAAEKDSWQDPSTPVVLWLNGGPGSSSILGMLQEMGPVVMNGTGGIMKNPYAWTKQANLLILEAPAGVGFSYCKEMLTGGNCKNTDLTTAADSRAAIQDFFSTVFPELKASSTTIVFNGDVDPCVSYEGTRTAIENVGFAVKPGGEYRPWFYNKTAATVATLLAKPPLYGPNLELHDAGAQFGGQVVNYEHNLSFATVHGSGHMVPQFRPQAAERLLSQLLGGAEYKFSPPMPTDSELAKMSDSEFDSSVDSWTDAAKLVK